MRSLNVAAWMLGVGMSIDIGVAGAEPLPLPATDYRAKAKAPQGVEMQVAHHGQRLRLDISNANVPGLMTSLVNLDTSSMLVMVNLPGMEGVAIEMALPPGHPFSSEARNGTRNGVDHVAGETCDLWRIESKALKAPVDSCITADGIVLRNETTMEGKKVVLFEVTELERVPQDPGRFELPKGVRTTKLPPGMKSLLPSLGR